MSASIHATRYYLILDEAQNIKNFQSQRWQTLLHFNTKVSHGLHHVYVAFIRHSCQQFPSNAKAASSAYWDTPPELSDGALVLDAFSDAANLSLP